MQSIVNNFIAVGTELLLISHLAAWRACISPEVCVKLF